MSVSNRLMLRTLVVFVFVEGVLMSVASNSHIINGDDADQLHVTMLEKHKGIPKENIAKRSAMHFRNFSNYFQGSTCKNCGIVNTRKNFLIIQGDVVDPPYKYPWMVRLEGTKKFKQGPYITLMSKNCGGAIISEYYILTAAHCLTKPGGQTNPNIAEYMNPEEVKVHFLSNTYALTSGPKVEKIIPHPQYNTRTIKHDIGLIKMKDKIICDMYKSPVCLPPSNLVLPEGQKLTAAGWGRTESGASSKELREGKVKNVNFASCRNFYAGAYQVEGTKHCLVGLEGRWQSTCSGDSGGPTFYEKDGKNYVVGVTSTGSQTCSEGHPFMHTSVPKYVDWIKSVMESSSQKSVHLHGEVNGNEEEKEEGTDVRAE